MFNQSIGFGVAGNFAGHLEQAGEAADFIAVEVKETIQPKAIFPFYLPNIDSGSLATYPLSATIITPPNDADNLQIEPEVALVCDVVYATDIDGVTQTVTALIPRQFGAYNDCSIRKPNAKKISEKKNWGVNSKGISDHLIDIDHFTTGGILDRYRIASFHCRDGEIHRYGEDSAVVGYSYFHHTLLDWIIERMNHQQDIGPTENIAQLLEQSQYPTQAVISIGATRYTPYGETHFLQAGDSSIVVVYDGSRYSASEIMQMATTHEFSDDGMSVLIQQVTIL
ncbi:hypothetical protein AYY26_00375 [Photobacterium phosphoreum]|uniref:DUF5718 family protein n=1 Tax=Photobacterium phosphoreum TaxID=659 RepID=UPI0007F94D5E|nr:DUF5718 family protein [Photobacterium phosphoreum]MCD9463148.1 hypothetical protein [Photobacterium phosphoreum]MCD9484534.1 hypothetical protein [Photobacterium phosphoreum]OBU47506.1 hypothetical protein AYY26_00375 [Photobacterium phosphoreum]